jgi:hypothetical protein
MTEADLWRDKFVTFEQYAEKLSVEAEQLRGKIGKEQRETRRLSGLVTLTAVEKAKLQSRLVETEQAHNDALIELERMRDTMERMEQERAEMVAEVEAQIERALASMAVDVDVDSDYGGELSSRPGSRMSTSARSASGTRSRRDSDAVKSVSHESNGSRLRSFGTESTLAESYERGMDDTLVASKSERETDTIAEEEEAPASLVKTKRFSATQSEVVQDGMMAVDEGISERSDKIAQKVLQIQQKLETALASENVQDRKKRAAANKSTGSDYATDERADESSDAAVPVRPRQPRGTKLVNNPPVKAKRRERSDTASTNRTGTGTVARHSVDTTTSETPQHSSTPDNVPGEDRTSGQVESETDCTEILTPTAETSHASTRHSVRKVSSGASLTAISSVTPTTAPTTPALTQAPTITTDESDTDFQSACSTSPRDSYGSFDGNKALQHDSDDSGTSTDQDYNSGKRHVTEYTDLPVRARLSSTATTVPQGSPALSDVTAAPGGRGYATRARQGTR